MPEYSPDRFQYGFGSKSTGFRRFSMKTFSAQRNGLPFVRWSVWRTGACGCGELALLRNMVSVKALKRPIEVISARLSHRPVALTTAPDSTESN